MDLKIARARYYHQKRQAAKRGIGWQLTLQQWLDWWGEDLDRRGCGVDRLQMQRVGDSGPYALGNIRKGVPRQNGSTYSAALQNRKTEAARLAHQAALDVAEAGEREEPDPEDESISSYMSRDPDESFTRGRKWDRLHRPQES